MSLLLELIQALGVGAVDLQDIIRTAPARYRVYPIAKRTGGIRIIAQPARELKILQHYILRHKLAHFPVHSAAMAYVEERNILQNAKVHASSGPILKLDFKAFFPSIKVRDWEHFARSTPINAIGLDDLSLYSKILFWGQEKNSIVPRCLSIGAPTSPMLSNVLFYKLDVALSDIAQSLDARYTRYADDITASADTEKKVLEFERRARKVIKANRSPRLTFNEEKTGVYFKGERRMVTGLVVTPIGRISLGRERKRLISSLLHRSTLKQLDAKQQSYLKGMLGFCIANEPEFVGRLRVKYGDNTLDQALKFWAPTRLE